MSDRNNKSFELDGTRPIKNSEMEVADTFEEDGIRPIAESPDFLVNSDRHKTEDNSSGSGNLDADKGIKTNEKRHINNNGVKVVDTFEEDGTRPIMANEYEVVDTLNIDGERPITSK